MLRLPSAATKGSSKFHLATWGRANLRESGTVDVTLCIAGDTLEQLLGLEGLPDGFGVPMYVRGTARGVRLSGVGRCVGTAPTAGAVSRARQVAAPVGSRLLPGRLR